MIALSFEQKVTDRKQLNLAVTDEVTDVISLTCMNGRIQVGSSSTLQSQMKSQLSLVQLAWTEGY